MAGFAERHNIYDDTQRRKVAEIINRIDADRIRTIRVGFAEALLLAVKPVLKLMKGVR